MWCSMKENCKAILMFSGGVNGWLTHLAVQQDQAQVSETTFRKVQLGPHHAEVTVGPGWDCCPTLNLSTSPRRQDL